MTLGKCNLLNLREWENGGWLLEENTKAALCMRHEFETTAIQQLQLSLPPRGMWQQERQSGHNAQ